MNREEAIKRATVTVEIKPCPFCAGLPEAVEDWNRRHDV